MKKNIQKLTFGLMLALAGTLSAHAQQISQKIGNNPTIISPEAALEIESTDKGLLLPRVALSSTILAAPLANHVAGMQVYNTATAGTTPNNVTPGIYYNDGAKWIAMQTTTVPNATTLATGRVQLAGDLSGTGTTATAPKVSGLQGTPVDNTAPTSGQILSYNGSAWVPADPSAASEVDGTIGNEITNVTATGGLARTGAGTTASPYLVGLKDGTVTGQVMQWDGTTWGLASGGTGTVTSVSGTAPVSVATGTTTPVISISNLGITNALLAADAVTSAKILDGTIANADLANGVGGIYKGSGSLAGATTVTQGANTLGFTSTAVNGFSVDGNTFSVDAANNRVGIGTSTPSTSLHLNQATAGAIRIVDGTQADGRVLTSDANGLAEWKKPIIETGVTLSSVADKTYPTVVLENMGLTTTFQPGKYLIIFKVQYLGNPTPLGQGDFHWIYMRNGSAAGPVIQSFHDGVRNIYRDYPVYTTIATFTVPTTVYFDAYWSSAGGTLLSSSNRLDWIRLSE